MKLRIFIIFIVVSLTGCTSIPIPTREKDTLLVGKLLVNWNTTGKMSGGNGKIKLGIKTYFQNDQTGKIISVTTQKDGWFFTNKLNGGKYTIQKFYIERVQDHTIYTMTLNGPFYISPENGVVNNMGTITIYIGNDKNYNILFNYIDYDVVKYGFQNEFPDSEWNSYEWINNSIKNNKR